MSTIESTTYEAAAVPTLSDTATDPLGPFAALQCTATPGTVKVHTVGGQDVTIYIALGQIVPLAVARVWSSGTTPGIALVGFRAAPYQSIAGGGS
jgi:hypothetical protein